MRITILGSGTSTGVPHLGCTCATCQSSDTRDKRLRASVLVETQGKQILIDCGPDFRQQALQHHITHLDAVLFTHQHYDHVGGIDDLRPLQEMQLYAEPNVANAIRRNLPYCFAETHYPGAPLLTLHEIGLQPFTVSGITIIPIRCYHAQLPIVGYRIGNTAYLTDIKQFEENEWPKLAGVNTLIVDALRPTEHFSHFSLSEAQAFAQQTSAQQVYFTHLCHQMGKHAEVQPTLPAGQQLCYDGLVIDCE